MGTVGYPFLNTSGAFTSSEGCGCGCGHGCGRWSGGSALLNLGGTLRLLSDTDSLGARDTSGDTSMCGSSGKAVVGW